MSGTLDETHLEEIRSDDEQQQSLTAFGGGSNETLIAVVRAPNQTGILDATDEWMEPLGMPRFALEQFWGKRNAYRDNSSISNAHNEAFDEVNIHDKYVSYLRNDTEAQECINEIMERLQSGENITLVCFESGRKKCHRHILHDYIERELPKFELTA